MIKRLTGERNTYNIKKCEIKKQPNKHEIKNFKQGKGGNKHE